LIIWRYFWDKLDEKLSSFAQPFKTTGQTVSLTARQVGQSLEARTGNPALDKLWPSRSRPTLYDHKSSNFLNFSVAKLDSKLNCHQIQVKSKRFAYEVNIPEGLIMKTHPNELIGLVLAALPVKGCCSG